MQSRRRGNWCNFFSKAAKTLTFGGAMAGVGLLANQAGSICRGGASSISNALQQVLDLASSQFSILISTYPIPVDVKLSQDTLDDVSASISKMQESVKSLSEPVCDGAIALTALLSTIFVLQLSLILWSYSTAKTQGKKLKELGEALEQMQQQTQGYVSTDLVTPTRINMDTLGNHIQQRSHDNSSDTFRSYFSF